MRCQLPDAARAHRAQLVQREPAGIGARDLPFEEHRRGRVMFAQDRRRHRQRADVAVVEGQQHWFGRQLRGDARALHAERIECGFEGDDGVAAAFERAEHIVELSGCEPRMLDIIFAVC